MSRMRPWVLSSNVAHLEACAKKFAQPFYLGFAVERGQVERRDARGVVLFKAVGVPACAVLLASAGSRERFPSVAVLSCSCHKAQRPNNGFLQSP